MSNQNQFVMKKLLQNFHKGRKISPPTTILTILRSYYLTVLRSYSLTVFFLLSPFFLLPCLAQPYAVYSCGFENWTDGKPDGWELASINSAIISPYSPAYAGAFSCKIENKGTSPAATVRMKNLEMDNFFPIYWGKKYVLSFAAKMTNCKWVELQIHNKSTVNNGLQAHFISDKMVISEEWQLYEIEFIPIHKSSNSLTGWHFPLSSTKNAFSINIMAKNSEGFEFVIDNLKFIAKDHTMEFDYLDVNNIKAQIDPIAPFIRLSDSPSDEINYFEVPKNSGKSTIFNANLWLGAKADNGQVYVAAQQYCQKGFDFWIGPVTNDFEIGNFPHPGTVNSSISDKYTLFSNEYISRYHHTWKVTKAEVEYHKAHYADPGYVMPWGIANWPAHGRSQYGESWNLAPFIYVSGNGKYTPSMGDYPNIRGDQAVFFIINDKTGIHVESGSPNNLGVEILGMAYAFDSPDYMLQNTIFFSYKIKNKSATNYEDLHFGIYIDFDLGDGWDDYIGCDSSLNLSYVYNGNEIDFVYGENPPVQGAMFLNQKMSAFIYNKYSGPTGWPDNYTGYYNFLRAIWKDGVPLTMWGTGYNVSGGERAHFMFSGDPINKTGWTEYTPTGPGSEPNSPYDRSGLMSCGPFNLPAGESITVDIALPFARSEGKSNLTSLALLKQLAPQIQQYYDEKIIGIRENSAPNHKLQVYPNPTNGSFTITGEKIIENVELYDIMGKKVFSNTPKTKTTQINSNLSSGIYFYRVVLQDHSVCSGRIVVQ